MMDEIVSWLGARYVIFEHWGSLILVACVALLIAVLWLVVARCRRWTARLMTLSLAVIPLGAFAATRFVAGYIQPLDVPDGFEVRSVTIPAPGASLAGHLLVPTQGDRVPAMLFLPGSDVSSYRTNYSRLVNEVLTPVFAEMGHALLYVDKRGVGRSQGSWFEADFAERAEDARAALRFLGEQPRIDPARLVVVGHSQGGWIAQILAGGPAPPSLAISLAGPAVGVMEQSIDDEAGSLVCEGMPEAEAYEQARAMMGRVRDASRTATRGRLRQFARIGDYRPDEALRRVRAPLLLLFGENDRLVPPARNLARLREIHGGDPPAGISLVTLKGAIHSLRLSDRCFSGSQRALAYSPQLAAEIRRFVSEHRP